MVALLCQQQTSLISFLSCDHGKLRREQRDISKRDLQKALKYATPQRSYKGRWKFEHDGIIFIVDHTMKCEITSYPSPLQQVHITNDDQEKHAKAITVLSHKPELCKSHTVLVVDNSGSMQTHDIPLHRDRQVAAYSSIALDYIAQMLLDQTVNDTDVVTLIEFDSTAHTVFTREPCTWVLYNKLLDRRETSNFVSRKHIHNREVERADSNYLPALQLATTVLEQDKKNEECALGLFFLSDGQPSDARQHGWTRHYAKSQICKAISEIATTYGTQQLSMSLVGFGNADSDFTTLQAMADVCRKTGNAKVEYMYCDKMAHAIGTSLTSLASSLIESRTTLLMGRSKVGGYSADRKRILPFASEQEKGRLNEWQYYKILDHHIYSPQKHHRRLVCPRTLPPGALRGETASELETMLCIPYAAINIRTCGQGAERIAFRSSLSMGTSPHDFVLGEMVAKETNLIDKMSEYEIFHQVFCETQSLASYLAHEFNEHIRRSTSMYCPTTTPIITFLPCSILVLEDDTAPGGRKSVLVEKSLDTKRFPWRKWNDNGGGVNGQAYHAPLDLDYEYEFIRKKLAFESIGINKTCGVIEECSDEEDSDNDDDASDDEDSDDDDDDASGDLKNGSALKSPTNHVDEFDAICQQLESLALSSTPKKLVDSTTSSQENVVCDHVQTPSKSSTTTVAPEAYLQAFSHFTYEFTNHKALVCDLQGVYNTDTVPPTFELTDPAIHYRSKRNRRMVYGRTDKGKRGIDLFFETHKCSDVCKVIHLNDDTRYWHQSWCRYDRKKNPLAGC